MSDLTLQSMTNLDGSDWLAQARVTLRQWQDRVRGRRDLARFSQRDLRDIGLTPDAAAREVAKPFWQP